MANPRQEFFVTTEPVRPFSEQRPGRSPDGMWGGRFSWRPVTGVGGAVSLHQPAMTLTTPGYFAPQVSSMTRSVRGMMKALNALEDVVSDRFVAQPEEGCPYTALERGLMERAGKISEDDYVPGVPQRPDYCSAASLPS